MRDVSKSSKLGNSSPTAFPRLDKSVGPSVKWLDRVEVVGVVGVGWVGVRSLSHRVGLDFIIQVDIQVLF